MRPDSSARCLVVGLGATGTGIAARLRSADVSITSEPGDADVTILALPCGEHVAAAREALAVGSHVVSLSDDLDEVEQLLDLASMASASDRSVIVGAGFAPGMSCLLARHAANALDEVVEIAVTKAGTGGPACARQHHRAMQRSALDWTDGEWVVRAGGSGRDLAWFPPPIGARDSYRAALPSPLLLQRVFPEAQRISARMTATRRDRLTSRLPMLRPPHADGGPGAIRVEVRGRRAGSFETIVYGLMEHPSTAAATVASTVATRLADGHLPAGAYGLGEIGEPLGLLRSLHADGLRWRPFTGADAGGAHDKA